MITLYSQPSCPQCRVVHMLLDKYKIPYKECQNTDFMVSKNIKHTPSAELETGEILTGKPLIDWINSHRG